MISMYDLLQQATAFEHITSGISSVDLLFKKGLGIYDFQTIPNCIALYHVMNKIIISHLQHETTDSDVCIISLAEDYPFEVLERSPGFKSEWFSRIKYYRINSIAKLIMLLNQLKSQNFGVLVLDNIHFLLDLYKLQLSATYQEILLRNYHNNLQTIRDQKDRNEIQGKNPNITKIPVGSDLLTESPIIKFNNHVAYIINVLTQICINKSLIFLTGKLDAKFVYGSISGSSPGGGPSQSVRPNSESGPSQNQGVRPTSQGVRPYSESSRPMSQGIRSMSQGVRPSSQSSRPTSQTSSSSSQSPKPNPFSNAKQVLTYSNFNPKTQIKNSMDSTITKRLMFYKDWFKGKFVFCVKIDGNVTYFDYEEGIEVLSNQEEGITVALDSSNMGAVISNVAEGSAMILTDSVVEKSVVNSVDLVDNSAVNLVENSIQTPTILPINTSTQVEPGGSLNEESIIEDSQYISPI